MKNKVLFDIDWEKVLEIDKHIYRSYSGKVIVELFFKSLLKLIFRRPTINTDKVAVDFLFVKVMQRQDYDAYFNQVTNVCPEKKCVIDIKYENTFYPRVTPFIVFFKYLSLVISLRDTKVYRSIYLLPVLLQYLEVYDRVNQSVDYKNLVVFSDMQPIENLLVQSARLNDITTVTMQHGLYIDYTRFDNINTVNYKNQVAEYFLAWGASTKELIHQWQPSTKIVICGKPLKEMSRLSKQEDYFTVLFDQNLLREYNREMLVIAYDLQKATGLNVNVRFHPRNNPAFYPIRKNVTYINKEIEESKFILAHTTSMIHEIIRLGRPVFKFKSIIPSLPLPENLIFSTAHELRDIIANADLEENACKAIGKEFILYINDESLKKYREFFETCKMMA